MNWIPNFFSFGRDNRRDHDHHGEAHPFGWAFWEGAANFNDYGSDLEKLRIVLRSPAALKVFALLCDLYSLGQIYVYEGKEEQEDAPELIIWDQPNPLQSQAQFKWTYMFWNLLGNVNIYIDQDAAMASNKLYCLIPHKIEWPAFFQNNRDKLIFSNSSLKTLNNQSIVYRYDDGSSIQIAWDRIIQCFDLTNGIGNFFKGNSRIDALCKIIQISESALDAKKTNIDFSGQFIVSGTQDPKDVAKRPLSPEEKKDIEGKVLSNKRVTAIKSMIDIQRYVSDMAALELDPAYFACAFQIGNLYGVPKDVLELYLSSGTYENQEKAKGAVVSYCLEPKSEDMTQPISRRIFSNNRKRRYVMSWDHLPFMQFAEKDKADVNLKKSQTLLNLQKAGVSEDDINAFMDTNFKNLQPISTDVQSPKQQEPSAGASNQSTTSQDQGQASA